MFQKFVKTTGGMLFITAFLVFIASVRFGLSQQDTQTSLFVAFFVTFQAALSMFGGGALLIKYAFKESLAEFGFKNPFQNKNALIYISGAFVILLPLAVFGAQIPEVQKYYSLGELSILKFLVLGLILPALYYASEEFLFRGFLFFGLFRRIGYHSFWISNMLFALFHVGKPVVEIPFAFVAGLIFSYLSLKTKSFVPAAIVHFLIALVVNILVTYTWGGAGYFTSIHF